MKDNMITVCADERMRGLLCRLPETFERSGTVIYDKRNQIRVIEADCAGIRRQLNVKRYCVPKWYNRLVYSFVRKPKAVRAYRNGMRLRRMGVGTPEPFAFIIEKRHGLIGYSYLVTEQISLSRTFYEFGNGGVDGREHILIAFARFTAMLHDKGVYHKDYSPGNILFDDNGGMVVFALVDINRMRFGHVGMYDGCANFARLWGQRPFFEIVMAEYASVRGFDAARCLEIALRCRHKFWKRYRKRHEVMFELGEL